MQLYTFRVRLAASLHKHMQIAIALRTLDGLTLVPMQTARLHRMLLTTVIQSDAAAAESLSTASRALAGASTHSPCLTCRGGPVPRQPGADLPPYLLTLNLLHC